ncbi:MAG TPA: branched-chain amino acid ABC transporter permease [Firmicutes bacterium]|nr:branched-chain amino acid ABC transporter permease [Bacillota bacterium]
MRVLFPKARSPFNLLNAWHLAGLVALILLCVYSYNISTFWLRIITGTLMWIGMAQSWNIIAGYTGYINFGHCAFLGVGAYTTGILMVRGIPFWPAMILGGIFAAILALIIGIPTLRLRGSYFAIATWALAETIRQLALSLEITGGAYGIRLPPFLNEYYFFVIMLVLCLFTLASSYLIYEKSFFGYHVRAIRENELAARSLGINTVRVKVASFAYSAFIPGLFGGAYAFWLTYIHPDNVLHPVMTDQAVVMALLGGLGTYAGPVLGAILLWWIRRLIWVFLGAETYYFILLGLLIMFVVAFMPDGIMGLIRRRKISFNIKENIARWKEKLSA